MKPIRQRICEYIADYINEEIDRGNPISLDTVDRAFSALEGGAHGLDCDITLQPVVKWRKTS